MYRDTRMYTTPPLTVWGPSEGARGEHARQTQPT